MKAFRKPIALLVALLMAIIPFCGFAEAGPVRTELDDALMFRAEHSAFPTAEQNIPCRLSQLMSVSAQRQQTKPSAGQPPL